MESHSLFEVNEYVKRVLALNFAEPIWINCEISQIKEVRGNYYLELVEQNESEEVIAQASAVIWYKSFLFLKAKLGDLLPSILAIGTHIKLKARIEFNERYGYKINIEDVDPTYTIGQLELNRIKLIERLKNERLWQVNKSLNLPTVIQRVAVISSLNAAGYIDFVQQLHTNSYGYHYDITLFEAAMQGQNTERETCSALENIFSKKAQFDAIFIIRGGGSKIDLSYFDNFNIAAKIAKSPLCVIAGIGHEIDLSVTDMVAKLSLKTPTACATMLIDHMLQYESQVQDYQAKIETIANLTIERQSNILEYALELLRSKPFELITNLLLDCDKIQNDIKTHTDYIFKLEGLKCDHILELIKSHDPISVLKKGFSLVRQNGVVVSKKSKFVEGASLEIEFQDGKITLN